LWWDADAMACHGHSCHVLVAKELEEGMEKATVRWMLMSLHHHMIRRDTSDKWILKPFKGCLSPVWLSRCRNYSTKHWQFLWATCPDFRSDPPRCRSSFHICKAGMSNLPPELDQILKDVDSNGSGLIPQGWLWMYPSDSRRGDVLPMFEGVVTRVCTEESREQNVSSW
jgi:hypothetical protein